MYRGKVTAVDASGVYVQTAEYGTLGPCQAVVANYAVADMVLCVNVGDEASPELVVVGRLTGTGSTTPGSSVDNTVARYDGTGGALQGSGVTIDDSGFVAADRLTLDRASGAEADLFFSKAGSFRWKLYRDEATESGSNAGSDFRIARRADDGSALSYVLTLWRGSGKVTLGDVGATAGLEFGSSGPRIMAGTGSPESVVTAPVGSLWLRTDSSTALYVKQTGTGNTGWIAK